MLDMPRVDVVMPAYNAGRYIEAALESIASQDVSCRIIVVDDGSSDDTSEKVRQFAQRHPDIPLIYQRQDNAGPSAARNNGLKLVEAEFVAMLDADDVWRKDKLAKQLQLFECANNASNLGVVYCEFDLIGEGGQPIPNSGFKLDRTVRGNVYKRLLYANLIAGSASAVLIRNDYLKQAGLFDENLVCAEDWDLWLRLARLCTFEYVCEPLVSIRQHSGNSQKNEIRMLGGELRFLDKLFCSGQMRAIHLWRLRRRVILGRIDPTQLSGFHDCDRRLQMKLSGWRLMLSAGVIRSYYRIRSLPRAVLRRLPGQAA